MSTRTRPEPGLTGSGLLAGRSSTGIESRWRNPRRMSNLTIAALAATAAVVAVFAPTQSTGWPIVDAAYRATFAIVVTFAASEARRWSWFILAGVAATFAQSGVALVLAVAALGVALGSAVSNWRVRRWGAVIGALSAQTLLRLPPTGPYGFDAVVTALAVAPVLVSAYVLQERSTRQMLRRGGATVALVLVVVVGAGAFSALTGLNDLDHASDATRAGIRALSAGDPERAANELHRARLSFTAANGSFTSLWAAPARLVPGVNAHFDALAAATDIGADLARTAANAAVDTDFASIGVQKKRIDLDRVRALETPMIALESALRDGQAELARIERDQLLDPLRHRLERLDGHLDESIPTLGEAIDAVRLAPDMLGANGARRYVLAFTTPSEARGIGGFWGFYGELVADGGRLDLVRTGRVTHLNPTRGQPGPELVAPPDYVARYGHLHPERNLQDVPLSPDFPSVGAVIGHLYAQQAGGPPVDGVILLDPYALAELLRLTGPIRVESYEGELTADNAAEFLVRGQYERFDDRRERTDVLEEFAEATFDALLDGKLRNPARLVRIMAPMAEQRRLLAYSRHRAEEELFVRLGLDGAFSTRAEHDDILAVVTQNAGNNKIDQFLHRSIDYDLTLDPATGDVAGTVTVELVNDADPNQLPDYVVRNREDSGQPAGVNWTWLSLYTPFDLESLTVDGQAVPSESGLEFGWRVYGTRLSVPPNGGSTRVQFSLRGALQLGDGYDLVIWPQPLVNPDRVHVTLRVPDGWVLVDAGVGSADEGHQTREHSLEGPVRRERRFEIRPA